MAEKQTALDWIETNRPRLSAFHQQIWRYAETAFREYRSAKAYCDLQREALLHQIQKIAHEKVMVAPIYEDVKLRGPMSRVALPSSPSLDSALVAPDFKPARVRRPSQCWTFYR